MLDRLTLERTDADEPAADCVPPGAQHHATRARLTAADGVLLHYRSWTPDRRATAGVLLFVHGIASHGGWFSETAAHLAERGIAVYAPDRRGSGLSGGPRGHLLRYEQAVDDLHRFVDLASHEHPGRPLFLAGSSWAAKVALVVAALHEERLAGLLLHGPGLFPRVDLSLPRKLAVLLSYQSRPEHQLPIPLVPSDYTRQPAHLEYIRNDPYRLLTASSRLFWETRRLDRCRDESARRLTLPILLQIGADDPMMRVQTTCRWFERLHAPDRTTVVYRGAAHTLDFEPEPTIRAYRADLLGWLRRQIGGNTRGETRHDR